MAFNEMINEGELSYGKTIPTYVGLPLDRAKETADILQHKYDTSKEAANQIEIALANMDLHEKDEPHRSNAVSRLETQLNSIKEKGNWEDASYLVQNSAKDVASDGGLINALKSQAKKKEETAMLQDKVNKGLLLDEDMEYLVKKSEDAYQGVFQSETTGAWKGHFKMEQAPDYVNIGDYADKFLTGFKADQWMGMYVKGKDGKWYKGRKTGDKTVDGQYIYMPTTEEATYDEVYLAAREHVMQNEHIKSRLGYEDERDSQDIRDKASEYMLDANSRLAAEDDLINILGYDEDVIKKMTDEQLAAAHHRETKVHTAIDGSALKHSYRKEKFQSFGMTWDKKLYLNRLKAAAGGGGDEKTVEVEKNYVELTTSGRTPTKLPLSVEEYDKQFRGMTSDLDNTNRYIETLQKDIQKAKDDFKAKTGKDATDDDVPDVLRQKLANANFEAARKMTNIRNFQKLYAQAVDKVEKETGQKISDIHQQVQDIRANYAPEMVDDAHKLMDLGRQVYVARYGEEEGNKKFDEMVLKESNYDGAAKFIANRILGTSKPIENLLIGTEDSPELIAQLKTLRPQIQDLMQKHGNFTSNLTGLGAAGRASGVDYDPKGAAAYLKDYVDVVPKNEELSNLVSDAFAELNKNKSTSYAYIDLSTQTNKSGSDVTSNYANQATAIVQRNPGNFRVITTDGKEGSWVRDGESSTLDNGKYNLKDITVLGPTMDYIHGYGYGFKAVEQLKDEKGHKTGATRELIITQATGTSLLQLTTREMKKGLAIKDGNQIVGSGSKGYEAVDDYIYKLTYQEIDSQLSTFQQHPPIPPADKTKDKEVFDIDVAVSSDRGANVRRNVYHDGTVDYDVTVWQIDDKTKKPINKKLKGYNDLFDVELLLEHFAGYGEKNARYSVDLGTLQEVSNTTLPYGKITPNMQSMPRLVKPFKDAFYQMSKDAKIDFTITSMTRSKNLNFAYNGAENSGHLFGEGVDISLKDPEGLKLQKWLEARAEPYKGDYQKVKGYDMIFDVHDRGSGMHIDLKWLKPEK